MHPSFVRAGLALLIAGLIPATTPAQNLIAEKDFYVADNVVEDIEVVGDSLYVAGRFHHVGRYTGPLAPVSVTTGETVPGFPEANGWIFGLEPDGEGGWLVGGDFTEIGGLPRAHVARLRPDLTVDPNWIADTNHRVYGFAVHDSTVYMHGFFNYIHGEDRFRIGSVSLATGELTDWNPSPSGGGVEDFFLDGDTLYVVGSFSMIAGEARRMAAFDLTTGDLTSFAPDVDNQILAVAARDGRVYVGGRFDDAGGEERQQLAAFDAATADLLPWAPSLNGGIAHVLALGDSTLYVGGAFSHVDNVVSRALAELDLETGAPVGNLEGTIGRVLDLFVEEDRLFVAGDFQELAGLDQPFLGAFERSSGNPIPLPKPLDVVHVVAAIGDTLFVGGEFGAVSGIDRNHFAAFHAETLELLDFAPDFQNIVWAVEANAAGDTLYTTGRFLDVGGTPREKSAAFDLATGQLTSFRCDASGDIYDLAVTDSVIYLAGTYHTVNGAARLDLAAADRTTGALTSWNPGSNAFVNRIYAHQDTVWVGGVFTEVGGVARTHVAAIDGQSGAVLDWGSAIDLPNTHEVESFLAVDHPAYPNGVMFLGGDFLNLGIGLRRGVAALDRSTGNSVYSWNPYLQPAFETEVRDFARVGDLLYVAGDFGGVFTTGQRGVAAIDLVTADATNWVVDMQKSNAIDVSDTFVFAGGASSTAQGYYHTNLAAFRRDSEAPAPPSALTATASTLPLRVDLAWSASPSSDVKDYVVYRTTTAGADTTGRQVGVADGPQFSDLTQDAREWFYRVFARDHAHNYSVASNEASATSEDGSGNGPAVTTALHQSPTVTASTEVVVVSDAPLTASPTVEITWPGGLDARAEVTMTAIPGAASAYRGPFRFQADGLHTIQTSVTTENGVPYVSERQYGVARTQAGQALQLASPGGQLRLHLAPDALENETYVVAEDQSVDGTPQASFGPSRPLRASATVEFPVPPTRLAAFADAILARVVDGQARAIPTSYDAERQVLRATVSELGTFRVILGDPNSQAATRDRLRLELAGRNPFRTTATFQYAVPSPRVVRLAIYDVRGRRVRTLFSGPISAGEHIARWHGQTDSGHIASAGVYFVRLHDSLDVISRRITRLH